MRLQMRGNARAPAADAPPAAGADTHTVEGNAVHLNGRGRPVLVSVFPVPTDARRAMRLGYWAGLGLLAAGLTGVGALGLLAVLGWAMAQVLR